LVVLATAALGTLLAGCGDSGDTARAKRSPGLRREDNGGASARAETHAGGVAVTLTATPSQARADMPIELDITMSAANASGPIGYRLVYGDGTSAAQSTVPLICVEGRHTPVRETRHLFHRYEAAGRYEVSVWAYMNCSNAHATASVAVEVT
jgi:hypothetical protein